MATSSPKIKIHNRLLTRLCLSHILIVSIPLFITGSVLVETAHEAIRQTILDRNLEFASRSTSFIDLKLKTASDIIKSQAKFQSIYDMTRSRQELAINSLVTDFDLFNQLSILDTSGVVIASTSFGEAEPPSVNKNKLIRDVLTFAGQDTTFHSAVYISEERLPLLDIAEPILQYNQVVGILYAVVDLKAMWDLVDQNKVGETGEAFIFDHEGVYIAHSDRKNVYQKKIFSRQDIIEKIMQSESGQIIYTTDEDVEMVAAYAPIRGYGWGAMLQQPTLEAFEPAHRMRFRMTQFLIISVILAFIIAYFYSLWIVKPVNQLVAGIDKFSRGDLDHRIAKVTDDEIGTLAENFNEMAERLTEFQNKLKRTEVLQTLAKLAAILSHEIRNPLNSMVINMQILKRELAKDQINKDRVEKFYGVLASEIKRVDQLVSDFLLIARPPKLEKTEAAINIILDDVLTTLIAESLGKGVRIERNYGKEAVKANIDVSKMRQVFINLSQNAIQAMPGGGKLSVSIKEGASGFKSKNPALKKVVQISFEDTGHGIRKRDLGKVFNFYYTTKDNGSGLGLAIVQQIVDEHQGEILVKSTVGKGTSFTIYLPQK